MIEYYSFPNKASHAGRLDQEIRVDIGLATLLDGVNANSGVASVSTTILTTQVLTLAEYNTLSGIVVAHIPSPLPEILPTIVNTLNGLSGIIQFAVEPTLSGIASEQTTDTTGKITVGGVLPSASGVIIDDLADQLSTIVAGGGGVVGAGALFAESEASSSSSSTTFQQKVSMAANISSPGQYRISWSFEWAGSKADDGGQAFRIQLDDTTTLMSINPRLGSKMRKRYTDAGGFKHITLAEGVHTVDLDYRSVSKHADHEEDHHSRGKNTVTIRRARLEIWRIS